MPYFLSFFLLLACWFKPLPASLGAKENRVPQTRPQVCRLFGSVYLTSDPKYKNQAQYHVYLEPEEVYADLLVFKENNKLFADGPGLWFITGSRSFADHVFFVTTNRAFADFSVHYTTKRTFAGCKE